MRSKKEHNHGWLTGILNFKTTQRSFIFKVQTSPRKMDKINPKWFFLLVKANKQTRKFEILFLGILGRIWKRHTCRSDPVSLMRLIFDWSFFVFALSTCLRLFWRLSLVISCQPSHWSWPHCRTPYNRAPYPSLPTKCSEGPFRVLRQSQLETSIEF